MTFRIQAKKFALCTNCGKAYGNIKIKSQYCKSCKSYTVHLFDSQSEASRFIHLKNSPNIQYLQIQPEFKLYSPIVPCAESWASKIPKPIDHKKTFDKWVVSAKYTADFLYMDTQNHRGWTIEDFKPCNYKTKKPLIDASTQLRLNLLHAQYSKTFDIITTCHAPKQGYIVKKVRPTKKD